MTAKARLVLSDARYAIARHSDQLHNEAFRTSWFCVVALLRAVGHALSTVDRTTSEGLRKAVDRRWAELQRAKPEPAIFWGFIEFERNRYLKNYEHGILRRRVFFSNPGHTPIAVDLANSGAGQMVQVVGAGPIPEGVEHGSTVSTLADGPFAGRRERDVAEEAIVWWSQYLDAIDRDSQSELSCSGARQGLMDG